MESIVLLNSSENTRQVEDEEKSRFVRSFLDHFGIKTNDIWDENEQMSLESKIKFRQLLSIYEIEIIGPPGGDLQIYHNNELVGEWKKPQYILKKDISQRDPNKKLYLEMKVNYWSILDNTE